VGLLLAGGGTWAVLHFRGKGGPAPLPAPPGQTEPRRLFVGRTGENGFPTLREALTKAAPGDTIAIATERVIEQPLGSAELAKLRGVTLESELPGGKAAVLEYGGPPGRPFFDLANVPNVRVRNVEIDGKAAAEVGVLLSNSLPGVTFEGVTVRNVRASGFRAEKAAGEPSRPLVLDHVRVVGPVTEAGVSLFAQSYATVEVTRHVAVRNSRFEGPGKAGVLIDGPCTGVEVSSNRFFKLENGVAFGPPTVRPPQVRVAWNTFAQVTNGLFFDRQPGGVKVDDKFKYDVTVTQNYFAQVRQLAQANPPGAIGVASQDNGFATGSNQGNVPLQAAAIPAPTLPNPKPEDDDTFLRFPAGPNKPKVGVQ
jgi:hypothetical protein